MGDKEEIIEMLGAELRKQQGIFNNLAPKAIHPSCSDETKAAFNKADRRIKELNNEIARLVTGGEPYEPTIFEKMFDYIKKATIGDDDDPGRGADLGVRG